MSGIKAVTNGPCAFSQSNFMSQTILHLQIIQFQEFEQIILFFEKLFCTSRDFPLLAVFEKRVPRRLKSSQKCESIYVEVFAYWLGDDIRIIIKEAKVQWIYITLWPLDSMGEHIQSLCATAKIKVCSFSCYLSYKLSI